MPQRRSREPCPQIRIVGDFLMGIVPRNASSGERVNSARLDSGSDECMGLSLFGRRNARTNVDKSFTGIEGRYLKLGKRKPEVIDEEELAGENDELDIRILLYGCSLQLEQDPKIYIYICTHTSAYFPPRPINFFNPLVNSPHALPCPSFSMRLVQSSCPVQMTSCCA